MSDKQSDIFNDEPQPAPKPSTMTELFGEVISSYSRAQAIDDGQLIDVSETAREAGIKFPTVVTAGVWETCVAVTPKLKGQGQSIAGRLWDVLFVLSAMVRAGRGGGDRIDYSISVRTPKGLRTVQLIGHCGPGDTAAPVITIMLPGED